MRDVAMGLAAAGLHCCLQRTERAGHLRKRGHAIKVQYRMRTGHQADIAAMTTDFLRVGGDPMATVARAGSLAPEQNEAERRHRVAPSRCFATNASRSLTAMSTRREVSPGYFTDGNLTVGSRP